MTQPIHPILGRVADAIASEDRNDQSGDYYHRMARAAVHALLEPDDGMAQQGADELFASVDDDWKVDARRVFRAMLLPLIGEG